tara:strand:+ start:3183 stop:3395 length:213 start_codon:yes stop_codon:yes gene_type:complete
MDTPIATLEEAVKELEEEINSLLAIWEKRDLENPDCWRRSYLPKVKHLESVRIAILNRVNNIETWIRGDK